MNVEALGVMIPIVSIVGIIVAIICVRKFENDERMAMINKGVDPLLFAKKQRTTSGALRASLLLMGAGVGLLLGYILDRNFRMEEVGYFSMVLLLGGAGLGMAYLIEEKKIKSNL